MVKAIYTLLHGNDSTNYKSYIIINSEDEFLLLTTAPVHEGTLYQGNENIVVPVLSAKLYTIEAPALCTVNTAAIVVERMTQTSTSRLSLRASDISGAYAFRVEDFTAEQQSGNAEQSRPQQPQGSIAINPDYTQTELYRGLGGYHGYQHHHAFNTARQQDKPWKIGVELELYARDSASYDTIVGTRSNWFQCERDASLNQANHAIEMKTIPLRACDAKSVDFWAEPMRRLKQLARSRSYTSTGLHVHIGKEIFGNSESERNVNLAKLVYFYTSLVELNPSAHAKNTAICGREWGYGCSAETPVEVQRKFFQGSSIMEAIGIKKIISLCDESQANTIANVIINANRNHRWDINMGNWNTYGTVEFRKGKGSISKMRMAGLVTWWEQMALYCKETPWAELNFDTFFNKVTSENPAVAYWFMSEEEC